MAAESALNVDCDWPLPAAPLFLTYQTRPPRFRVTEPMAVAGVAVAPVLLEMV